jgi:threonine/homoserine/homoserine lactone efflux protein
MVFNTSASYGFVYGVCQTAAVALIDALYIALSCAGASAVVSRPKVKPAVRLASGLVLALFGANTIAGAFGFSLLPDIALFSGGSGRNLFIQGLLLAASNPLTIVSGAGYFRRR